jgi:hypothetical protein
MNPILGPDSAAARRAWQARAGITRIVEIICQRSSDNLPPPPLMIQVPRITIEGAVAARARRYGCPGSGNPRCYYRSPHFSVRLMMTCMLSSLTVPSHSDRDWQSVSEFVGVPGHHDQWPGHGPGLGLVTVDLRLSRARPGNFNSGSLSGRLAGWQHHHDN